MKDNSPTEKLLTELERTSEVINDTLWYVNPNDIRKLIPALLQEERDRVVDFIANNDDTFWFKKGRHDDYSLLLERARNPQGE